MIKINTPISDNVINSLKVGDMITISGSIYCGRDIVLPKIVELIQSNELDKHNINLLGSVIFHTAVSPAGIGPTSSNKEDIETSIPILSKAGVKIHLGKGKISQDTINTLDYYNSLYAVIPPVTALLRAKTKKHVLCAFPEYGMEAFYQLVVEEIPAIIAGAHGRSIY